jgi:hypothetical protein
LEVTIMKKSSKSVVAVAVVALSATEALSEGEAQATSEGAPTAEITAEPAYTEAEVTPMTTIETAPVSTPATTPAKAPKAPKAPRIRTPYPFRSKASILAQIATDDTFMLQCLQVMHGRQLSFEQEQKSTVVKNRRGWQSSHAHRGTTLAVKDQDVGLSPEEMRSAAELVGHYGRQLAEHFRSEQVAANPELSKIGAIFGV